jgi:hypothetical protein
MTDAEFLQAFEACKLPHSEWTHTAHVRMAWLYLRARPPGEALVRVCEGIKRYNASRENSKGYHETITRAYLILIAARMRPNANGQTFSEFAAANPDLVDGKLRALLAHYHPETLFSAPARAAFVPPDLAPLPSLAE